MPVTLKDIAQKLNVSITTVSRALAGYSDISPSTRERVQQLAAEMGYVPNMTARQLQKQSTDTIGFIIPTTGPRFADPFFSEFLAGVGNEATAHGFDLLVSTRAPGEEEQKAYARLARSRRVDGFVIVRTRRQDWRIQYLSDLGFPFVAFGRAELDLDFPYIGMDGRLGIRAVMDHLIGLGHERIAFIAAPPDLYFSHERTLGYQESLMVHGLPFDPRMVVTGDLTQRGGYEATRQLLAVIPQPTAIVASNDTMALGAMSAIQDANLVVGRDIAVTGFDGISQGEHSHPPLTTVAQPVYEIGQ